MIGSGPAHEDCLFDTSARASVANSLPFVQPISFSFLRKKKYGER